MVPKPFFGTEVHTSNDNSSSAEEEITNPRKKTQKVLGIYHGADGGGTLKMLPSRMTEGTFDCLQGLVGHDFRPVYSDEAEERPAMYDRAVLLQSIQNYRKVADAGFVDPKLYFRRKPSWGPTAVQLDELRAIPCLSDSSLQEILRTERSQENEKVSSTPYFDIVAVTSDKAVASVLGVYARGQAVEKYMPRSQVQEASFAPTQGIEGSMFWHLYDTEGTFRRKSERAVLLQSIQSYRRLRQEAFKHFPDSDTAVLIDPCFGEQVILDIPGDVCLGDVYGIQGSTLKMRVTSPRKPCSELDKKNNTEFGSKGIRHFTTSRALAGWFCEVLIEGTLAKGSVVELLERPFPKWTMQEIAMAVYGGEGDPRAMLRACASWGRPVEQLHQLLSVPYFAEYEWKNELRDVLAKIERTKTKSIPCTYTNQTSHVHTQARLHGNWASVVFAFMIVIVSSLMILSSSQTSDLQLQLQLI